MPFGDRVRVSSTAKPDDVHRPGSPPAQYQYQKTYGTVGHVINPPSQPSPTTGNIDGCIHARLVARHRFRRNRLVAPYRSQAGQTHQSADPVSTFRHASDHRNCLGCPDFRHRAPGTTMDVVAPIIALTALAIAVRIPLPSFKSARDDFEMAVRNLPDTPESTSVTDVHVGPFTMSRITKHPAGTVYFHDADQGWFRSAGGRPLRRSRSRERHSLHSVDRSFSAFSTLCSDAVTGITAGEIHRAGRLRPSHRATASTPTGSTAHRNRSPRPFPCGRWSRRDQWRTSVCSLPVRGCPHPTR